MDNSVLWTLIGLQLAMGTFDIVFHHEGTERLAWRKSQKTELRLHAIRNLFYAVLFIVFGWFEPHGFFAIAMAVVLATEVVVTLWDFVEEDRSRKLPATERVTHALLALNYGAILALAAPILVDWAGRDTALVPTHYGLWSGLATFSAFAVALFGLRDLAVAARTDRLDKVPVGSLAESLGERRHILITGGTGFVGKRLIDALVDRNHSVSVLTRDRAHAAALPAPIRILTDLDQIGGEERIDSIVNLAGEPVADGPWTKRKRRRILVSRLRVTGALIRLIDRLDVKPESLISGSAVGWYGSQGDMVLDEKASGQDCFGHRVCDPWEKAACKAERHGVRVVRLRIGLVLGVEGGMLAQLLTPFEFALGGPIGDGRQWMPWIALDDMVRLIAHAIGNRTLQGPVNATAPNPVRNNAFTKALAGALNRPAYFRIPAMPLKLLLGDFADELLLASKRVVPAKAEASGFTFLYPALDGALEEMTGAKKKRTARSSKLFEDMNAPFGI